MPWFCSWNPTGVHHREASLKIKKKKKTEKVEWLMSLQNNQRRVKPISNK
jgi:hypothetical protein